MVKIGILLVLAGAEGQFSPYKRVVNSHELGEPINRARKTLTRKPMTNFEYVIFRAWMNKGFENKMTIEEQRVLFGRMFNKLRDAKNGKPAVRKPTMRQLAGDIRQNRRLSAYLGHA